MMNRHCIPGLTMSIALTGNPFMGVSGIIKSCTSRVYALMHSIMPTPRADTWKKPTLRFSV